MPAFYLYLLLAPYWMRIHELFGELDPEKAT
jgi:hypothetical protein